MAAIYASNPERVGNKKREDAVFDSWTLSSVPEVVLPALSPVQRPQFASHWQAMVWYLLTTFFGDPSFCADPESAKRLLTSRKPGAFSNAMFVTFQDEAVVKWDREPRWVPLNRLGTTRVLHLGTVWQHIRRAVVNGKTTLRDGILEGGVMRGYVGYLVSPALILNGVLRLLWGVALPCFLLAMVTNNRPGMVAYFQLLNACMIAGLARAAAQPDSWWFLALCGAVFYALSILPGWCCELAYLAPARATAYVAASLTVVAALRDLRGRRILTRAPRTESVAVYV